MLNLLPQIEKKRLIGEYRMRLGVSALTAVCILLVVAIVGLFPSYASKKAEMQYLMDQKQQAEEHNSEALLQEADSLTVANKAHIDYLDARISTMKATLPASAVITKVFARRTGAITLQSVAIAGKTVSVQGVAATRADLIAFHSALREEPEFKDALLPISDIARSTSAEFVITIALP